jgi:hypothetical protein
VTAESTRRHLVGLLLLTLAAWYVVVRGTFQFDDFSSALWASQGTGWRIRPLLALTFAADRALYGTNAAGFLAENLVLHCLTVLVVYTLARRILHPIGAFLAGAAFTLQPAHAEVIAYVSGRSTGLMSLLLLSGLWVWTTAHDSVTDAGRRLRIGAALILFAAAVLVKEVALVFPLLVLVWEHLGERRGHAGRRLLPLVALAALLSAGLAAIPRYRALAGWSLDQSTPIQSLSINASAVPFQLSLWVRPGMLSVEHPLESATLPLGMALGVLIVTCAAALLLRRKEPNLAFALAWIGVTLAPTQSLVLKADVVTEKPLYLAWVGVSLLLGGLLTRAFDAARPWGWVRPAACIAAVAAALVSGAAVHHRVHVWSDPVLLWRDATAKAPHSSRAWNNLGNALRIEAPREAIAALRRSLSLDPSNPYASANLANLEALCPTGCSAR